MSDPVGTPDMTGWSEKDKEKYAKYKIIPKKSTHATRVLAGGERQHFDSADYEMQKDKPGKLAGAKLGAGVHPLGKKKSPIPDSVRKQMAGE